MLRIDKGRKTGAIPGGEMSKTLLEKAKNVPARKRKSRPTDEEIELALAWLKDEITTSQVNFAYSESGKKNTTYLYNITMALKEAYIKGKLKITKE